MNERKELAIPRKEPRCVTVPGADQSTMADTLDSLWDHQSAETLIQGTPLENGTAHS